MGIRSNIRFLGILMLTAVFLCSCNSDGVVDMPFIPAEQEQKGNVVEYRIILSDSAGSELSEKAQILRNGIEEQTGVRSTVFSDGELLKRIDGTWEIYLGNIDRAEAKQKLSNMRSNDYTCRSENGVTVMGGRSEKATVRAIERFMKEILPVSNSKGLIPEGGGFDFFDEYATDALRIGETNISDFKISVYDYSDAEAVSTAISLSNYISETFGYCIDISDNTPSADENIIYLEIDSENCQSGRAEVGYSGKDILLKAPDAYGLKVLVNRFLKLLSSDGISGVLNPHIPSVLYVPYENNDLKIGTLMPENILPLDTVAKIKDLSDLLHGYAPDMVHCGRVDGDWAENLREAFYEYESIGQNGGAAFIGSDVNAERILSYDKDGLLCEAFYIRQGELELLLLNISGSVEAQTEVDISELLPDDEYTVIPVVVVACLYNSAKLTLTYDDMPYFDPVINAPEDSADRISYSCYADLSRLSVTESGSDDKFGYKQITVSIA